MEQVKVAKVPAYKNRKHCLMLYPEDSTHMSALAYIERYFDYAYILHDRDVWTEADEKKNPEHKAGTLKKPHYHVVVSFKSAKYNTGLAKELGITPNYIQECRNFDLALEYLIHHNEETKHQYSLDEVKGSLRRKLQDAMNKDSMDETDKSFVIFSYITSADYEMTITEVAEYALNNRLWSEFRRGASIFIKIIDEHNKIFSERA